MREVTKSPDRGDRRSPIEEPLGSDHRVKRGDKAQAALAAVRTTTVKIAGQYVVLIPKSRQLGCWIQNQPRPHFQSSIRPNHQLQPHPCVIRQMADTRTRFGCAKAHGHKMRTMANWRAIGHSILQDPYR